MARRGARRVRRAPRRRGRRARRSRCWSGCWAEHRDAADAVRRSRATEAEPIAETAAVLGGEPAPFQWAAVRYALRCARDVPGRRAGPRQDGGGARHARGRRRVSRRRRLPRIDEARLGARDATVAAAPVGQRGPGARPGAGGGRDHHRQLRGRRRAVRGTHPHASARPRRRRVALLQEPAGQAHPGGAPPGRGRGARRPATGAERDPGAQPRRGAHRPAAHHRAHGGVRLRRQLRPTSSAACSPRSGCIGTCAAPASCAGSSPRSSPSCRPSARW